MYLPRRCMARMVCALMWLIKSVVEKSSRVRGQRQVKSCIRQPVTIGCRERTTVSTSGSSGKVQCSAGGHTGRLTAHESDGFSNAFAQQINLFKSVIEIKTGPGGGGDSQSGHNGLGAVMPGAYSDAILVK